MENKIKRYIDFVNEAKSTTTTLELNDRLLSIISGGMYDTMLSVDNMYEEDVNRILEADIDLYKWLDNKKYDDAVIKESQKIIDNNFTEEFKSEVPEVKSVKLIDISHPKQYNYSTDSINIDVVIDNKLKKRLTDLCKTDKDLDKYLSKTFKSGPGYMNQMPEDCEELVKKLDNDPERAYAAYFNYVIDGIDKKMEKMRDDNMSELYEALMGNYSIFEFLQKETPQEVIDAMNKATDQEED